MSMSDGGFLTQTTKSLARKLNHQVTRVKDGSSAHVFPPDILKAGEVETQFLQHIGFPESADSVAYEPFQKLLAVRPFATFSTIDFEHPVKSRCQTSFFEIGVLFNDEVLGAGRNIRWNNKDHREGWSRGYPSW